MQGRPTDRHRHYRNPDLRWTTSSIRPDMIFGKDRRSAASGLVQAGFLPPEVPLFEVGEANASETKRGMLVLNASLGDALSKKLGEDPVILMCGHGDTVVDSSVKEATIRTIYTHIDAQAQSAAMALNPKITPLNDAELATNKTENFDADRPWRNYKQRLPGGQ